MNKQNSFTTDELWAMIDAQSEAKIVIETGSHTVSLEEFDIPQNEVTVNITNSRKYYIPLEDMKSKEPYRYTGYICGTEFSFEFDGKQYTADYEDASYVTKDGELICQTDGPSISEPFDCYDNAARDVAYAIVVHFVNLKLQQWQQSQS